MTIQGGNEITGLYTVVSGATATASEHDVGYSEFISPDFEHFNALSYSSTTNRNRSWRGG